MAALTFRIEEVDTDTFQVLMTHDTTDYIVSDAYLTAEDAALAFTESLYASGFWDAVRWDDSTWWKKGGSG